MSDTIHENTLSRTKKTPIRAVRVISWIAFAAKFTGLKPRC
jgi:hypothetical protein